MSTHATTRSKTRLAEQLQIGAPRALRNLTLWVYRQTKERKERPTLRRYEVPLTQGLTVLEALHYVKEKIDATLSYRYSCRMGICGSCAMVINGVPRLACETQVSQLNADTITVEPLRNFTVVRDLVADLGRFFAAHRSVKPFLIRRDVEFQESSGREYPQMDEERLNYLQFSYCIMCGLCDAACPIFSADQRFLGPQALAQSYRYMADGRDEGFEDRVDAVDHSHGCWRCHLAGSCSVVCPKGVDPELGIQLLKRLIIKRRLGLGSS